MRLTLNEIQTLLGIALRGLRNIYDVEDQLLDYTTRYELGEIIEKTEGVYADLRPWAPDVEEIKDDER